MNPVQRIINYYVWRMCKHRIELRKKEDAKRLESIYYTALTDPDHLKTKWRNLPKRLRKMVHLALPQKLKEAAENRPELFHVFLQSAQACEMQIPTEEKQQLLQIAIERINWPYGKLRLARLLYGEKIPINIVQQIADDEMKSGLRMNDQFMQELVAAIRPEDTEASMEAFAQKGGYYLLKQLCIQLDQDIPQSLLRICFDAHRAQDKWMPDALVRMCIDLKDWEAAKELIHEWKDDESDRQYARRLALAIFEAQNQSAEA